MTPGAWRARILGIFPLSNSPTWPNFFSAHTTVRKSSPRRHTMECIPLTTPNQPILTTPSTSSPWPKQPPAPTASSSRQTTKRVIITSLLLILLSSFLLFALILDRPRPLRATSDSAVANTQLLSEEYLWAMRGDEKADAVLRQSEEEPEIDEEDEEGEEGEDSQIDGQEEEDNDNNDDDDDDGYDEDMPWKHGNMELLQGPFEPRYNTFARTMRLEDDGKKAIWAVGPKSMEWLVPLDPE